MENASKALIIAGAILLAILLISLGLIIYNQASGIASSTGMDSVSLNVFNQKFAQYEGSIKGSKVKSLLQEIITSNSNDENIENQVKVDSKVVSLGDGDKSIATGPISSKTYTVKCNYSNGRVVSVTIE